ncbi:hypothetical protein RYH73_24050 [Olivibacter sp. CPCC 100613]
MIVSISIFLWTGLAAFIALILSVLLLIYVFVWVLDRLHETMDDQ